MYKKQIEKEKINVYTKRKEVCLFREDIDAWRQDSIKNRGNTIGYLITTKCSHTTRQVTDINNCMKVDKEIKKIANNKIQLIPVRGKNVSLLNSISFSSSIGMGK
ncbi:MAG: hypothetical protein K1W41_27225 [Lachnospiraceae bacterium]